MSFENSHYSAALRPRILVRRALCGTIAIVTLGALMACEPIRRTHGYAPLAEQVARVSVGTDTRAEVSQKIGRPGTVGLFDDSEWYYISRSTETRTFRAPKVTEQRVVVVDFDDAGTVTDVNEYGVEDGQVINLVTRTTPTRGRRLTVLQQLLGNIGRFGVEDITGESSATGGF